MFFTVVVNHRSDCEAENTVIHMGSKTTHGFESSDISSNLDFMLYLFIISGDAMMSTRLAALGYQYVNIGIQLLLYTLLQFLHITSDL